MLCAIYKSPKKDEMYLYVAKRDDFSSVPNELLAVFGKPQFVMLFNLSGEKSLARANKQEVLEKINREGFYLQLPPPPENLHQTFVHQQTSNSSR